MKQSKRAQEIAARRAADPIAQLMERDDVDYSSDELPSAPRGSIGSVDMMRPYMDKALQEMECDHDWMRVFPDSDPRPLEVCTKCESVRNQTVKEAN